MYSIKQKQKEVRGFHNIFSRFFKILEKKLLNTKFSIFDHSYIFPWGHVRSHTKFGLDRFSRFDVYWIQTNRHPHKQTPPGQAKYIYKYFAWVSVCLFCVEPRVTPGKVYYDPNFKNLFLSFFCKILQLRKNILKSANFFVYVL